MDPDETGDELTLRPLEPPRSNAFCFMCTYGGSTEGAARDMIQGIKNIIHEGVGKRSIHDVCDDVLEYYEAEIRQHVEGNREWSIDSIKRHILETETDLAVALELDLRSLVQCMQHLRDNMIDDTTNMLYTPHLNSYIKLSAHLHKISGNKGK